MITSHTISSGGAGAYVEYLRQDALLEYYIKDDVSSTWGGKAADFFYGENLKEVGQGGAVKNNDLKAALEGRVTDLNGTDRQLGRIKINEAGEQYIDRRAGYDLVYSSPKSVSIGSEVFANKDFEEAHKIGVKAFTDFMEKHAAQARISVDGKTEFVKTGNLLFAKIEHSTARAGKNDQGHVIDPHKHTHCIVANQTLHAPSGKWYALSNEKVMDLRHTADLMAKNAEAAYLQSKGYKLEFDGRGGFEYVGYNQEIRDHFSNRDQQIKEEMARKGTLGENGKALSHHDKDRAGVNTKAAKDTPNNAEYHRGSWQQRAESIGAAAPVAQQEEIVKSSQAAARDALYSAMSHITEKEAAFTTQDLYKSISIFSHGRSTPEQIEHQVDRAIASGDLVLREDGKYTTAEMIREEKWMAEHLKTGQAQCEPLMSRDEFDAALKRFESDKGAAALEKMERSLAELKHTASGEDRLLSMMEKGHAVHIDAGETAQAATLRTEIDTLKQKFMERAEKIDSLEKGIDAIQTGGWRLSDEQRSALKDVLVGYGGVQDRVVGLQGDPGTGKTTMLQLVKQECDARGIAVVGISNGKAQADNMQAESGINSMTTAAFLIAHEKQYKDVQLADRVLATYERQATAGHGSDPNFGKMEKGSVSLQRDSHGREYYVLKNGEVYTKALYRDETRVAAIKSLTEQANQFKNTREMIVMDEAGQTGQKEGNAVIHAAEQRGAQLVMQGDIKQHHGVPAGRFFELAQKDMHTAVIGRESIRRQQNDYTKGIVASSLDGRHGEAYRKITLTEVRSKQDEVQAKWAAKAEKKPLSENQKTLRGSELKAAAREDNISVINKLAKDYTTQSPQQQRETLVITATNADKRLINEAIRNEYKATGGLQGGNMATVLEKTDRSETQLSRAIGYQKGDTVQFQGTNKSLGIEKGAIGEVTKTDLGLNTVSVKLDNGKEVTVQPDKIKMDVYQSVSREFAPGDRVRMEKNTKMQDGSEIANGDKGSVEKFDGKNMSVKLDSGKTIEIDVDKYKNIQHAHADTSHAAQGQSKNPWIHHNTEAGRHGDKAAFVNVTRSIDDAKLYTQNIEKAEKQVGVEITKTAATVLDAAKPERGIGAEGSGKVVDMGNAPYEFKEGAKGSYFVTLENSDGTQSTLWGKELQDAAAKADIRVGDTARFEVVDKVDVQVPITKDGHTEWISAQRNVWDAEKLAEGDRSAVKGAEAGHDKVIEHSARSGTGGQREEGFSGKIVDQGIDKYQHKPNGTDSYFVTIEKSDGSTQTLWGKGLPNALEDAGLKTGDTARLVVGGKVDVHVEITGKDGKPELIDTHRNEWKAEKLADGQQADRVANKSPEQGQTKQTEQQAGKEQSQIKGQEHGQSAQSDRAAGKGAETSRAGSDRSTIRDDSNSRSSSSGSSKSSSRDESSKSSSSSKGRDSGRDGGR